MPLLEGLNLTELIPVLCCFVAVLFLNASTENRLATTLFQLYFGLALLVSVVFGNWLTITPESNLDVIEIGAAILISLLSLALASRSKSMLFFRLQLIILIGYIAYLFVSEYHAYAPYAFIAATNLIGLLAMSRRAETNLADFALALVIGGWTIYSVAGINALPKELSRSDYFINHFPHLGEYIYVYLFASALFLVTSYRYDIIYGLKMYRLEVDGQSVIDPLTGLYNRHGFFYQIENDVLQGKVNRTYLLLIDLDYFKRLNAQYSHRAGDLAIQHVAAIIDKLSNKDPDHPSVIGRLDGELFTVCASNRSIEQTVQLAEAIRTEIEKSPLYYQKQNISMTVSIGLREYDFSQNIDLNLYETDSFLYMAKANGRNQVRYH
jgi:diguanylate cyclase (GGDEF)-like protein